MAEFLEQEGIPVSCDNKTGYFQTREITVMLNYLSIVDNIYQDIPMAVSYTHLKGTRRN